MTKISLHLFCIGNVMSKTFYLSGLCFKGGIEGKSLQRHWEGFEKSRHMLCFPHALIYLTEVKSQEGHDD